MKIGRTVEKLLKRAFWLVQNPHLRLFLGKCKFNP
jgi:hypothetical protein